MTVVTFWEAEGCRNEAASSHTAASCIIFKNSIVAPGSRIKTLTLFDPVFPFRFLIAQYLRLVVVNAGEAHMTKASSSSFFVHTVYTNPYSMTRWNSSRKYPASIVQLAWCRKQLIMLPVNFQDISPCSWFAVYAVYSLYLSLHVQCGLHRGIEILMQSSREHKGGSNVSGEWSVY